MNQTPTAHDAPPARSAWRRRVRLLAPSRVVGIDIARGVALFGMMATHTLALVDDHEQATWTATLFSGRASALFCMIAGIALAITSPGPHDPKRHGVKTAIWVRGTVLVIVGVALATLFDPGIAIILVNYGILFMIGSFFLRLRFRVIAPLAALWLIVAPLISHVIRPHLEPFRGGRISLQTITEQQYLLDAVPPWVVRLEEVFFTGYYPVFVWLGYFLLGVAIGRLPLRKAATGLGLFFAGIIGLTAVWAVDNAVGDWTTNGKLTVPENFLTYNLAMFNHSVQDASDPALHQMYFEEGFYGTVPTNTWWWQLVSAPHTGTVMDNLNVVGSSLLVIGFFIALTTAVPFTRFVLWPLAAAGSMTFTLYTVHVIIQDRFYTNAWAYDSDMDKYLPQVVAFLVVSVLWSLTTLRGPMEALTRWCAKTVTWILWPNPAEADPAEHVPAPPTDSVHPPQDAPLTDSIPIVVPHEPRGEGRSEPL